jgi:hypothetical protein
MLVIPVVIEDQLRKLQALFKCFFLEGVFWVGYLGFLQTVTGSTSAEHKLFPLTTGGVTQILWPRVQLFATMEK